MMKNLKSLLIATILFLGTTQVNAQAKVAHIDTAELTEKYPAMIEARKQLDKLSQTYQAEYKTLTDQYQATIKKYEAEASTVTEKMNQDRQKEVLDLEKRIQEYGQNAQKELGVKEGDLLNPVMEKVKLAIQKVGKAKGYQYVLNSAGLLLADGPNLTADVKKELGF